MKLLFSISLWLRKSGRKIATGAMIALAGLLFFHVLFGANGMLVYQQKRTEYKKLDQEIKALQEENSQLNQNIKLLKTDPKTIEKEAREQLHYARPGEVIYSTPAEKPKPDTATARK